MKNVLLFLCICLSRLCVGQLVYVGAGARVFIGTNVFADGSFQAATNSELHLNGELRLSEDMLNEGSIRLDGSLELGGKWVANGNQEGISGEVIFRNDTALIEGTMNAVFAGIRFTGLGSAQLFTNVECDSAFIHDRIVNTHSNSLFVRNSAALLRNNGYVISERYGGLQMPVEVGVPVLFHTGNLSNYYPIELLATEAHSPKLRFANEDASQEDLPRSFTSAEVCGSNATFYHVLEGIAPNTSCRLFTNSDTSLWEGIASRSINMQDVWTPLAESSKSVEAGFFVYQVFNIPVGDVALILYTRRPEAPVLTGLTEVCSGETEEYLFTGLNGNNALWEIAGGSLNFVNDSTVRVDWENVSQGIISLRSNASNGCTSLPVSLFVTINSLPEVEIGITPEGLVMTYQSVYFNAIVNESMAAYAWTIGSLVEISDSSFSYSFSETGNFPVFLEITDSNGCKAQAETMIEVLEFIGLSNAFSPNGDGKNDVWKIDLSGLKSGELQIFDRWGVLVLQSNEPQQGWDGRTPAGEAMPAGTYFYVLRLQMQSGIVEKRGSISLFY